MPNRPRVVRAQAWQPMPDGTGYAALPPLLPDSPDAFGAGLVRIPPGALTWSHNHRELEWFVVLSGDVRLHWEDGCEMLRQGDAVLVPPLVSHAFSSARADEPALLFHHYGLHAQAARDALELRSRPADRQRRATDILLPADTPHAAWLAGIACRRLAQCGTQAGLVAVQAGGIPDQGAAGPALDLEQHRHLLLQAIDQAALTPGLRVRLARELAGRLPVVEGAVLERACEALAACRATDAASGRALVVLLPADQVPAYAMALPVLLLRSGLPAPAVLHALDAQDNADALQTELGNLVRGGSEWLEEIAEAMRACRLAAVPSAGRWSGDHLAAWAESRALAASAASALEPEMLDARRCMRAISTLLQRAQPLVRDLPAASCESFEAENRTALAIALAVAAQIAVLLEPLAPEAGRAILARLGLDAAAPAACAGALELLPAGAPVFSCR